jgi:hypothetical protein
VILVLDPPGPGINTPEGFLLRTAYPTFALLLIGAMCVCIAPEIGRSAQMSDETTDVSPEKSLTEPSELQKFARCFRADWRSHVDSFYMLAYNYIQQLPPDRKAVLAEEFRVVFYESDSGSDEALLQSWYEQGAEVWDPDSTVRPVMSDFYWMMNPTPEKFDLPAFERTGSGFFSMGLKSRRRGGND